MSKNLNEMLNPKQIDFLLSEDKVINLLTGSVRSGKTYISLLKWAIFVANMPENNEFLMVGKTITSLKRNCLGLLQDLVGTNFTYSTSQKMGILFGRKIWLEGANDERAESKIRGMTLAGAYVDELTQIPFDFYAMLLSRLSVKNAKLYATTNPDSPTHWVKEFIIDNNEIEKAVWTFTLDDNEILKKNNKDYFDNLRQQYQTMGNVYFQRFVQGLWVMSEGIIYQQFANNPKLFIKDEAVDKNGNKINFLIVSIGIDYGATRGQTTFKATGITPYFKEVWCLDEVNLEGLYTPEEIYEEFDKFYYKIVKKYGKVTHAWGDWGSLGEVLSFGLNRHLQQKGIPLKIDNCIKLQINDRIYLDCFLFANSRMFILKECEYLINAYKQAVWDDKREDTRLDDGTTDIDSLDAHEYSISAWYDKLMTDISPF